MPRYGNIRLRELRKLLLRMGFVETARNDHWRYRHFGLGWHTFVSFGNKELDATFMGRIIADQVRRQLMNSVKL